MFLLSLSAALACGGLFCDGSTVPDVVVPVQQTEEVVVFAVDEVAQTTTMHVQISYEGPVSEFAWILPVKGVPELQRSTQRLFDRLSATTQETWSRTDSVGGNCLGDPSESDADADSDADSDADTDADTDTDQDGGVTVVSSGAVGPYETVVLSAETVEDLTGWLRQNGYQVPDAMGALLEPYVAPEMYFVALKLRKDRDVGDIEPLALVLEGTTPSIPMRLTAVAAADDMPLSVYVLGPQRALPSNYLHVERNLMRALWPDPFGGRLIGNQPQLLSEAADAAGGQAFATLYAGQTPPPFHGTPFDLDEMNRKLRLIDWLDAMAQADVPPLTRDELEYVLPAPSDGSIDADSFYACVRCYALDHSSLPFDGQARTAALYERVLQPLERVDQVFLNQPTLTRLATTLSASEMTLDPSFVFVQGLPMVSNQHFMRVSRRCMDASLERTPREMSLDERSFVAPSDRWLERRDLTLREWMYDYYEGAVLRIQSVDDGELVDIADFRDQLPGEEPNAACGCDQSTGFAFFSALPLLGLLVRRRR